MNEDNDIFGDFFVEDSSKDGFWGDILSSEELGEALKEFFEDAKEFFHEYIKENGKDLIKAASEFLKKGGKAISPDAIRFALGYSEYNEESVNLERLIAIVKEKYTGLKPGDGVAVLIGKDEGVFKMQLMAVAPDKTVYAMGSGKPYVVINTTKVAPDLRKAFGDKRMIVLK